MRFKIDFTPGCSRYSAFSLLFWKRFFIFGRWITVDTFETIDAAKAHYEKVKDLPEYLP